VLVLASVGVYGVFPLPTPSRSLRERGYSTTNSPFMFLCPSPQNFEHSKGKVPA